MAEHRRAAGRARGRRHRRADPRGRPRCRPAPARPAHPRARPRQRRHRHPGRGRRRRRRGARQRGVRRRRIAQGRAVHGRVALPPAGRHRASTSAATLAAAAGARHPHVCRRRRRHDAAARRRPLRAALLGHGQRGLGPRRGGARRPATTSCGCRSTAGPSRSTSRWPRRCASTPRQVSTTDGPAPAGSVRAMPQPFRVPDDLAAHGLEFIPDGLVAAIGADAIVRFMNSPRRADHRPVPPPRCVGRDIREALPLQDLDGASWWELTNPWDGLATRTGHRERLLVLPSGREVLVTAKYVRSRARRAGAGRRPGPARRRGRAAGPRPRARPCSRPSPTSCAPRSPGSRASPRPCCATGTGSPTTRSASCSRRSRPTPTGSPGSSPSCSTPRASTSAGSRCTPSRSTCARGSRRRSSAGSPPAPTATGSSSTCPRTSPPLWADPDRLEQIIANLVENAVRHGRGTVRLAARPTSAAGRPAVDLLVRDDGDGIAAQHRELVFSRFWQGGRQARDRARALPRARPRRGARRVRSGRRTPRAAGRCCGRRSPSRD